MFKATLLHPSSGKIDAHKASPLQWAELIANEDTCLVVTNWAGERVLIASRAHELGGIDPATMTCTEIIEDSWKDFTRSFSQMVRNKNAIALAMMFHKSCPRAQFVPPRAEALIIDKSFHYRSSIADQYFRQDLDNVVALVLLHKKSGERHRVIPLSRETFPTMRHIKGAWFAFGNLDEAVLAKMSIGINSEIFEVA